MATVSGEREESDGGVSTERIEGLWKTAWNFLEKSTPHYVTMPHIMVQSGMEIFEVSATWDSDSLESLTVASWKLSPSGSPQRLKLEAKISYKYLGDAENQSWEHRGAIDDSWINRVEKALNEIAENVNP
jgi:hypothetical protein